MRSAFYTGGCFGAFFALAFFALMAMFPRCDAAETSLQSKPRVTAETIKELIENKAKTIQLVTFSDTAWSPVRVMRGSPRAHGKGAQAAQDGKVEVAEIIMFGEPQTGRVRIVRGDTERTIVTPEQPRRTVMNMQIVTFADPRERPVSIFRGSVPYPADTELFGPASDADLDRVAFAVDGAESRHGADLRMWRPEPSGPQGPMQVTAAAAMDVGGGDRFDLAQNRALGRAYLALMYRRYGNWPDAIAAYNWGPGNLDWWISGGRAVHQFPLEVERYRDRVLRNAALGDPAD